MGKGVDLGFWLAFRREARQAILRYEARRLMAADLVGRGLSRLEAERLAKVLGRDW